MLFTYLVGMESSESSSSRRQMRLEASRVAGSKACHNILTEFTNTQFESLNFLPLVLDPLPHSIFYCEDEQHTTA